MKALFKKSIVSVAFIAISTQCVLADVPAFNAPASDAYSPGESDSKWILGVGLYGLDNPYIQDNDSDDEYLGVLDIRVEYRGERFFVDGDGLGVTLLRANGFSAGAILSGNETYLSDRGYYKDNSRLDGIKERDGTADLGLYLIHNYANGQFKITALEEISGEHHGESVDVKYLVNVPVGNWNITPVIGAVWNSKKAVQHFLGVSQEEVIADRAAYDGKNSTSIYGAISARYDFNDHWDVNISQSYIKFGDGIADSPLIKDDYAAVTGIGVNYNF